MSKSGAYAYLHREGALVAHQAASIELQYAGGGLFLVVRVSGTVEAPWP